MIIMRSNTTSVASVLITAGLFVSKLSRVQVVASGDHAERIRTIPSMSNEIFINHTLMAIIMIIFSVFQIAITRITINSEAAAKAM